MMPGGDAEAYKHLQPIVEKVAAQTDDGACVTYIGPGGAGARGAWWSAGAAAAPQAAAPGRQGMWD